MRITKLAFTFSAAFVLTFMSNAQAQVQAPQAEVEKLMRSAMPSSAECERKQSAAICRATDGHAMAYGNWDWMFSNMRDLFRVITPPNDYGPALVDIFKFYGFADELKACLATTNRGTEIRRNNMLFACNSGYIAILRTEGQAF